MGIPLGGGNFTRGAAIPLDDSFVAADATVRDAINAGIRYEGMLVYVVADQTMYQLQGGITNGDWVVAGGGGAAVTYVDQLSGDDVTTTFPLGADPLAVENTMVFIDGVYQQKLDSYDISGTDIIFVDPPPVGSNNIEVVYVVPASPLVIPNGYITTAKLADDAVTTDKILDASVTDDKIDSMDAAKLTGTMPTANLPTSNIFKTASSAVFSTTTSAAYVDVTNLSQAITCSGTRAVEVSLESNIDLAIVSSTTSAGRIAFVRNGTVLNEVAVPISNSYVPSTFRFLDASPPAGSNTYKIQIKNQSGTTVVQYCSMVVRET